MIGVSFQPGSDQFGQQNGNGRPSSGSGVQEAIKILSLRLPRVLGAQSAASMPLLTSQGSGGNPRIDSIVNQVLSRVMPGQQPPMPMQPAQMGSGPTFTGTQNRLPQQQAPWTPPPGFTPRVVVDNQSWGDTMHGPDGRPMNGGGPGMFEPLPNVPLPTLPNLDEPIFRRPRQQDSYGGGADSPFDTPMF